MMTGRLPLCLCLLAVLAACSDTTWRRDTVALPKIDGRKLEVSWVRAGTELYDLEVAAPDTRPLELTQARRAAEHVLARHCRRDDAHPVGPAVSYGGGIRHAFRYRCGDDAAR